MSLEVTPEPGRVFRFIEEKAGAPVRPGGVISPLPGGAVLRHFLVEFELATGVAAGKQRWVLRADGITKLGVGLPRAQEFAMQRVLFRAGLKVAAPLFVCCDEEVFGAPFYLMRFLPGEARGAVVAQGANPTLAEQLARELAKLHRLDLARALHFLPAAPQDAAAARIAELAALLAEDEEPHPIAEWALRWLKHHKPEAVHPVLCHGDFRTGNYLVGEGRLVGVLDWDFAQWSDPAEDIAWFCAKSWRFGALDREAGGIASRAEFYRAYQLASGRPLDPVRIRYWEVMAALRWLVIALKQRDRFMKQGERSLDLALTGRRPAECELEILLLTLGEPAPLRLSAEAAQVSAQNDGLRDRPSAAVLRALTAEARGEEEALVERAMKIAAREGEGDAEFAAVRYALRERYGALSDEALLRRLADELRAGVFDRPGAARRWLQDAFWHLARAKLRESNPELLAASGLT